VIVKQSVSPDIFGIFSCICLDIKIKVKIKNTEKYFAEDFLSNNLLLILDYSQEK